MNKSDADESKDALDPRIQIALEKLNTTTDDINKLELEYDEANTAFRILLNESTRKLKTLSKKHGSCIDKARPYYEAAEVGKQAQLECQKAAVAFRKANEFHAAAKETVTLAEQQFLSNKEWQFDNAWQEMLNHATMKVFEAENAKAECGREHQRRAVIFKAAEDQMRLLEDRLQKYVIKARPYFIEKTKCQDQLNNQKNKIETIKNNIAKAKNSYALTLKELEQISNEIHFKRNSLSSNSDNDLLKRPREPGVGAELSDLSSFDEDCRSLKHSLPDFNMELDKCEIRSPSSMSGTASSVVSDLEEVENIEENLDDLKSKVKELALRPTDGGEGKTTDIVWESELKNAVEKLDHLMLMQERAQELHIYKSKLKEDNIPTHKSTQGGCASNDS